MYAYATDFSIDRRTPLFDPFHAETTDLEALNVLLRGELSAAETYASAIEKFADQPLVLELKRIHNEHLESAGLLRDRIRAHEGEPAVSSGVWGGFAAAITNTAKIFGVKALLVVLRQGEEHGISEYQKILNKALLSPECVSLIEGQLVPRCRYHVSELHRLSELID